MRVHLRRIARCLLVLGSFALWVPAQTQETGAALSSLLKQAQTAQGSGDYADAASLYARATALAPATPELWSNRGVMELLAGRKDASIVSLKHAMQLNSRLYTPLLFLGKAYVETGRPGDALPYLRHAHTLRPDDVEVLLTLARASMDAHQLQAALAAYSSASKVAPQNGDAWFGMGVSSLQLIEAGASTLATTQPESIWSRALLADDLFAQGRPIQATSIYRAEIDKATPAQKAILLKTLQWMLYWSIKADERIAVSALSRFETLSSHATANYVLVGNLFRMQRQPDKALNEYKKALAEDAHNPAALKGAILTSVDANRFTDALAYERTALADQPSDPELNLLMAEVLDQQNDRQQEELYLERASRVAPELQPRLHYLLARLDKQEGKLAEAIQQYQLALPGDKDGSMHYQLSRIYRETGNLAAAQQALAEARLLISKRNADATTVVHEAMAAQP